MNWLNYFLLCCLYWKTDAEKLYKAFTQIKNESDASQRHKCDGCLGLFGKKSGSLDHYEKRLRDIEHDLRKEQASLVGKVLSMSKQP